VELFLGYSRFGVGSNFSSGTAGNRVVGLNGGSAALEFNFNRYLGLVGDFGGYASNKLEITGTGVNQPRDVDASGTAFTYMFGPRLHFRRDSVVSPFAQVLVGGIHATAVTVNGCSGATCTPLPLQNALAMTAGGGIDIRLSHHIALRAVQAEYMLTRFAAVRPDQAQARTICASPPGWSSVSAAAWNRCRCNSHAACSQRRYFLAMY
jgi:opacity protein-like surface antigen